MFSTPGGTCLSLDVLHGSLQRREGGSFLATGAALLGKRLMRIIGYTRGQQAGTADRCQDRYSQFCPLRPLRGPATTSRGTRALGPLRRHLVHRCLEAKNSFPLCASAGKVPGHRKGPPMCGYCLQPYNTASKMTTTRHQLCKATQEPLLPSRPQTCRSPPVSPSPPFSLLWLCGEDTSCMMHALSKLSARYAVLTTLLMCRPSDPPVLIPLPHGKLVPFDLHLLNPLPLPGQPP